MYVIKDWAARLAGPPSPERMEKWERTWRTHLAQLHDIRWQLVEGELSMQERSLLRTAEQGVLKTLRRMEPPMIHRRRGRQPLI